MGKKKKAGQSVHCRFEKYANVTCILTWRIWGVRMVSSWGMRSKTAVLLLRSTQVLCLLPVLCKSTKDCRMLTRCLWRFRLFDICRGIDYKQTKGWTRGERFEIEHGRIDWLLVD